MNFPDISRRRFVQLTGTTVAAAPLSLRAQDAPTAQAVVERVQTALGGDWQGDGLDGFKAGDPGTPVKGVVTTAMATADVLKKASAAGANLIFTHEPTFFGRLDGAPAPARPDGRPGFRGVSPDDPVYVAKKEFIEKNGLVVFRFHDNWLARKGPQMTAGLADALGWSDHRVSPDDSLYDIPAATAEQVVAHIKSKLNLRGGLRAVGDRTATVRRVMLLPGFTQPELLWTRYSEVDLTITGEVREWECTFYAADMFTAGRRGGLITIGRVASEDPGMNACAQWLKTIIQEVPVQWISAGDLYWRAS